MKNILRRKINRMKEWLSGTNVCPNCGKIHHKMSFGITNDLCPECYSKLYGKMGANNEEVKKRVSRKRMERRRTGNR